MFIICNCTFASARDKIQIEWIEIRIIRETSKSVTTISIRQISEPNRRILYFGIQINWLISHFFAVKMSSDDSASYQKLKFPFAITPVDSDYSDELSRDFPGKY